MATSNISDTFRKAEKTDIERIWQIIGQAKADATPWKSTMG